MDLNKDLEKDILSILINNIKVDTINIGDKSETSIGGFTQSVSLIMERIRSYNTSKQKLELNEIVAELKELIISLLITLRDLDNKK